MPLTEDYAGSYTNKRDPPYACFVISLFQGRWEWIHAAVHMPISFHIVFSGTGGSVQ